MNRPSEIKLFATHPHPCSYLSEQEATTVFIDPNMPMNRQLYSQLSDCGFRRNGQHVFKPHCTHCKACIATRLPVAQFTPNRTQRRLLRRNQDITQQRLAHIDDDTVYRLYENYICQRHPDGDMHPPDREQYLSFLSDEWNTTRYLGFYLADKLIAVAVMDQLVQGLSAVYTFFDTSEPQRSLGSWAILQQIALAQQMQLDYLYLGYWIKESPKMAYKGLFQPLEILRDGQWVSNNCVQSPA
jgi:arginyl-tRNA--protein-N-Asp/Glu arginylyltransferase